MKKLILINLALVIIITAIAQPKVSIDKIASQLEKKHRNNWETNVYFHTDKDVYFPEETVWFNLLNAKDSDKWGELKVALLNEKGEFIEEEKYQLNNWPFHGDFILPESLLQGNYYLAGIFLDGQSAKIGFTKKIAINPNYKNEVILSTVLENEVLLAGQPNKITIQTKELSGALKSGFKLLYSIYQGDKLIKKDKLKTGKTGIAVLEFTPIAENGRPYKFILSDTKGLLLKSQLLFSETDQIQLSFYPEGGNIIPGKSIKMGFYAKNMLDMPVEIKGKVFDKNNHGIAEVATGGHGFGHFILNAEEGNNYWLKITGRHGQDQEFELPPVNPNAMSLAVNTKQDKIIADLFFADGQKHDIVMFVLNNGKICWSSELVVPGTSEVILPTNKLPGGLSLITCISDEEVLLAERIIYNDVKQNVNVEVHTNKEAVKPGDDVFVKIKLTDGTGSQIAGNMSISVSDVAQNTDRTKFPVEVLFNRVLDNPLPMDINFSDVESLEQFLIANQLRKWDWNEVMSFYARKSSVREDGLKDLLSEKIKQQAIADNFSANTTETFFKNNEAFFTRPPKIRKVNLPEREPAYKTQLENGTNLAEIVRTIKPYSMEGNKIVFYGSKNSFNAQGGALIVLDGQQMGEDASVLNNISPHDVEDIRVSTSPMDIQRYTGLNSVGIIEITTKRGTFAESEKKDVTKEKLLDASGYRISRKFSLVNAKNESPFKSTLYWNADLKTDSEGTAELTIPASQLKSGYKITVNALSDDGRPGTASETVVVSNQW